MTSERGPVGGAGELTAALEAALTYLETLTIEHSPDCSYGATNGPHGDFCDCELTARRLKRIRVCDHLHVALAAKAPQGVPACLCGKPGTHAHCDQWPECILDRRAPTADDIKRGQEIATSLAVPGPVSDDTIHHGVVPPMNANQMLDNVVASLRMYPYGGGDERVMTEVERIVQEAVVLRTRLKREAAAPKPAPACDHGNATSAPVDTCRMAPECRERNPLYCPCCGSCEHEGHDKTCPNPEDFTVTKPAPPPDDFDRLMVEVAQREALAAAPPAACEGCRTADGRKTTSICAECVREICLEARHTSAERVRELEQALQKISDEYDRYLYAPVNLPTARLIQAIVDGAKLLPPSTGEKSQ